MTWLLFNTFMPHSRILPFLACCTMLASSAVASDLLDRLEFGSETSEKAHTFTADYSDTIKGLLGESARRLLPLATPAWNGGVAKFTMKVDPKKQNYFTARFSGDEINENRLVLYIDGKQIGWRHLGEVEQLDFGTWEPAYNGRFYYNTSPLPLTLTKGKTTVQCEIRSSGRIWGYGQTFEKYQKTQAEPSRGIYSAYTHTDGCFVPPSDENQGVAPTDAPVRPAPGAEVLDQIKDRVNKEIDAQLASKKPSDQMQASLLAKAYDIKWTHAYQNKRAVEKIVASLDALYAAYVKNPTLAQADPSTWNPDWFGLGVIGQIVALRQEQLAPSLDEKIDDGKGGKITRRAAFADMLVATRDWHRLNRRQYTNQTMINDLNGIYYPNRGIEVLDPSKALSESKVRRYLYESLGLQPWTDSDPGGHMWNVGPSYFQLTDKGLTKELGYVGTYGEVIDLVTEIYDATRPSPGQPGDEKIKAQVVKIALARAAMRYPSLDAQGNRVMRLEQIIGWRDSHYPGEIAYGQRATRDASALQAAASTLDPQLVAYARQMIADNQFFESEVHAMSDGAQPLRTTIGRLETPDQYELINAQPAGSQRLPMSAGQPDFVFTDEEDGVVAIKNGDEILYASLYWRARAAINFLARVHDITPRFDRIAVVAQETTFEPGGMEFTRGNWTNLAFGDGGTRGLKYPGPQPDSAYSGEKLPIPKLPDGIPPIKPGQESPYAGRGQFYTLRYGPYLIGLNMTKDKTFDLVVPADMDNARELVSKRIGLSAGSVQKIAPLSTAVLFRAPQAR